MHSIMKGSKALALAGAIVACLTALAGCSADDGTGTASSSQSTAQQGLNSFDSVQPYQAAVDLLPDDVKSSGKLRVVMNVSSAPTKFYDSDGSTIIGINPDIARLLGKTLGLETEISDVQFDGIIPALQADRFDLAVASMAQTPERLNVLDMISYGHWGSSLLVGADSDVSADNICGKTIAVQQGSIQQSTTLPSVNEKQCTSQGKSAVNIVVLPSQQDSLTQVSSGRVDGTLADTPVLGYAVSQAPEKFKLAGSLTDSEVDLATVKDSDLTPAIAEAMRHIVGTQEYAGIFSTWGLDDGTIDTVKVNGQ